MPTLRTFVFSPDPAFTSYDFYMISLTALTAHNTYLAAIPILAHLANLDDLTCVASMLCSYSFALLLSGSYSLQALCSCLPGLPCSAMYP
jgi:hypothetical protein